jgi:hypothetical protein
MRFTSETRREISWNGTGRIEEKGPLQRLLWYGKLYGLRIRQEQKGRFRSIPRRSKDPIGTRDLHQITADAESACTWTFFMKQLASKEEARTNAPLDVTILGKTCKIEDSNCRFK